jgi:amino acid permease
LVTPSMTALLLCGSISSDFGSHPPTGYAAAIGRMTSFPRGGGDGRKRGPNSAAAAPLSLSREQTQTQASATNGVIVAAPSSSATKSTPTDGGGGASVPTIVFSLVKSIVGAGVLGLPAGVAAVGSTPLALVPAVALTAGIGFLSAYCFGLIGRVCSYTSAHSYREAWERSVGPSTGWIPALACSMVTLCSVLAYSMILADTVPSLVGAFTSYAVTRTQALIWVTLLALLPLCLMKSLKSLGPFSLIGIVGMVYTSLAMAFRFFAGSYASPGGEFAASLPAELAPSFGDGSGGSLIDLVTNPKIFLLVSMLSTAYMAHYNAPKFYWELRDNTPARYRAVVAVSFGIAIALFVSVASFGFATFGTNCAGLVLRNYSTRDGVMSLSRVAVASSITFSYPLAFGGVRDGLLDLVRVPKSRRTDALLDGLTVALLTVITAMAYFVKDLRKLLAFNGATWGNAVIYLLPTYMFVQCVGKMEQQQHGSGIELRKEVPRVIATGVIGLCLGIVGTVLAVQS